MTQSEYAKWRINPTSIIDASYMSKYSSKGSLDTRDIVARATDREMKASGDSHVLLVTEHLNSEELVHEFPTIASRVASMGIRLGSDPIPVRPAAHYLVGGVSVDHCGRALRNGKPMPGLYAIGEVARTGLHGANRLASNSLLEAVVYSERAAEDIISRATNGELPEIIENLILWRDDDLDEFSTYPPLNTDLMALRSTMTNNVGLVKSDTRLSHARQRISEIRSEIVPVWHSTKPTQSMVEFRNLIICAELVTEASMARRENVGLHWNIDLE